MLKKIQLKKETWNANGNPNEKKTWKANGNPTEKKSRNANENSTEKKNLIHIVYRTDMPTKNIRSSAKNSNLSFILKYRQKFH